MGTNHATGIKRVDKALPKESDAVFSCVADPRSDKVMKRDIFQSDIDLAKHLICSKAADDEILRALARRNVEPTKAAQLVNDLRSSRPVTAADPTRGAPERKANEGGAVPTREPHHGRHSSHQRSWRHRTLEPAGEGRTPGAFRWGLALLFVCLGLSSASLTMWHLRYHADTRSLLDRLENATSTDQPLANHILARRLNPSEKNRFETVVSKLSNTSSSRRAERHTGNLPSPHEELVLELQPDGLHIGNDTISRTNALSVFSRVIGTPTRTNTVEEPNRVIYAFDNQGVLVYSQPGVCDDYIVFDCDAQGGTHGTTLPFTGQLKLESCVIQASTDSITLASMKNLGLNAPEAGGSILAGNYHGLGLYFAYLKTQHHLSLIEINLK